MQSILTVTTPAGSSDLTTIADVKADLGITSITDDALLTRYVAESSLEFAAVCNRVFGLETVAELMRPTSALDVLVMRRRPIVAITSIVEDDDAALTVDDYELDKAAGMIWRLESDCRRRWYANKLVVTYQAGYALPGSAPRDLQKAVRAIVKAQYLSKGRDPLVRSEAVPGVYEVAYWVGGLPGGAAWPADIAAAIARYTHQPVV